MSDARNVSAWANSSSNVNTWSLRCVSKTIEVDVNSKSTATEWHVVLPATDITDSTTTGQAPRASPAIR